MRRTSRTGSMPLPSMCVSAPRKQLSEVYQAPVDPEAADFPYPISCLRIAPLLGARGNAQLRNFLLIQEAPHRNIPGCSEGAKHQVDIVPFDQSPRQVERDGGIG